MGSGELGRLWRLRLNFIIYCRCCSVTQSCPTLCDPTDCSTPGLTVPHHLPKFAQVHVHCISDAIQPSQPLTSFSSSALNLSQHQGLFQWVSCSHQMTKIQEFQVQHQAFQEYSGLIFLKIDWFDLLAIKGTLRSLLQHHSSHRLNCGTFVLWNTLQTLGRRRRQMCITAMGRLLVIF